MIKSSCKIKNGVDDVLYDLYNNNYFLKCDRWKNGVEFIKGDDGKKRVFN